MSFQLVMIVGKPPDNLGETLAQELNQDNLVQSIHVANLEEAQSVVGSVLPDLMVLFPETDTAQAIEGFCQAIRAHLHEHRPIVVIATPEHEKDQRIAYFLSGADDVLDLSLEPEEFAVRLLVHLRRNVEQFSNSQTRLPGLPLFCRLIQRRMNLAMPWAFLVMELNHFDLYHQVYGQIPSEQILKTLASLLKTVISPPDIVGQTDSETFLILTTPEKAERIAERLCQEFDQVVPHFYSARDQQQGYLMSVAGDQVGQRVPFVCLSIGIVTSENVALNTYMAAINTAIDMKQVAKGNYGSNWMSERLKLTGSVLDETGDHPKRILIVESDAAMAFLLKSTLEMQGYTVETSIHQAEAQAALLEHPIDLLLVDPTSPLGEIGWGFCQWVRTQDGLKNLKMICLSTQHEREKALSAGADLYLPKPFELSALFTWVDKYLKR
jgi:DNA-binding response OmpR family regulator